MLKEGAITFELQVTNSEGETVSLREISKEKHLLLFIISSISTDFAIHICTTLRDNMKVYRSLDTTIAAVSSEKPALLNHFKQNHNLNYQLLHADDQWLSQYYNWARTQARTSLKNQNEPAGIDAVLFDQQKAIRFQRRITESDSHTVMNNILKQLIDLKA